jgi:hypothetical protein
MEGSHAIVLGFHPVGSDRCRSFHLPIEIIFLLHRPRRRSITDLCAEKARRARQKSAIHQEGLEAQAERQEDRCHSPGFAASPLGLTHKDVDSRQIHEVSVPYSQVCIIECTIGHLELIMTESKRSI